GEVPAPEEPGLPEDLEALLRLHREAINSLYEHVRAAPEDFASITWDHPFFGPMNWRQWMVFISVHTADHADQLERMAVAGA
ncbi:MAG: DinB family protein, partial [Tepidiformaceae bacterium]